MRKDKKDKWCKYTVWLHFQLQCRGLHLTETHFITFTLLAGFWLHSFKASFWVVEFTIFHASTFVLIEFLKSKLLELDTDFWVVFSTILPKFAFVNCIVVTHIGWVKFGFLGNYLIHFGNILGSTETRFQRVYLLDFLIFISTIAASNSSILTSFETVMACKNYCWFDYRFDTRNHFNFQVFFL